ncbi:MAG: hypothetical protein HWD84_09895 [Flavobacteriaceae bacterium]|nr:hypothetical protein [Flavobacteriaceae bacterium]
MKHTQYFFVLLIFFSITSGILQAQSISFSNDDGIETSSGKLQSSNSKLLRDLKRLKKKGRKELSDQYPDASEAELDSLIEIRKVEIEENLKDSAETDLARIRKQMVEDILETPEKLPVSDEVKESIEALKELEAMELLEKDSIKAKDIFTTQNLKKINKKAGDVLEDLGDYKSQFKDWDKALLSKVESIPEAKLLKEQIEKAAEYKALPDGYREDMSKFQTNEFVKEQLETLSEELEKIGESIQERFDNAILKVQEAKEEFPSLESLEEAPKRYNPYRDEPFFKRLKFGGNLSYVSQKPVSVDLALNVIYPINKRMSLGAETAGRIKLEKADPAIQGQLDRQGQWSIRSVARYHITPFFYAQANYEVSKVSLLNNQDNTTSQVWYNTLLVGLGRKFTIKEKIALSVTTFYDVFFNPINSPNSSAWVIRLGFNIGK